jgi:peptidoglycan/xylan/chitin deacetylase (PgdA/CDA1 family)
VPVLHRWGFTATVFLLPGRLGGENSWEPTGPRKPLFDAQDVRCAASAGMEIASHGLTHLDLTRVTNEVLHTAVHESRRRLTVLTGGDIDGFCYTYGFLDERAVAAVRGGGYRYACSIGPGPAGSGDFALPRIHLGQADTSLRLELKRRLARVYGRALEAV